ncbi:MAG: hypothetical protein IH831_01445 [Planctomycetes bacterium]|nr:hypothetical protein [Planctomycetota bacterium]
MLRDALSHEIAGTGRRALCLAGLLVALWPAGSLAAEPVAAPELLVPEKPAPTFEQQRPRSFSEAASQFSPGNIINSLRNSVRSFGGNSAESLPAPESTPWPDEQQVIPMNRPDEQGDVTVEDHQGQISLMVRDASLRQVIALIAETQKLNLVFATPAETRVTASFDRVPWQQVFDSLLSASGHTWTTNNGVITVTSIGNADSLPPGAGGRHVEVFDLDFASAVDIDQTVKGLLSPAGKSWIMETSSEDNRRTREAISVVDYPANLQQIAEYISLADQPPRQVLIEAHILQIDLEDDCLSGINFEAISTSASGNQFSLRTVGFANPASTTAFFLEDTAGAITNLVELLQTTTDAKTLASPRVMVVNGQKAKIQIGERLGYLETTTTQTITLQNVKFLDVGQGRSELLHSPRIVRRRQFLEPGIDVLGKQGHRTHRFIVGHEASLTHHQQMSESTRVLPEILQLLKDLLRSSS